MKKFSFKGGTHIHKAAEKKSYTSQNNPAAQDRRKKACSWHAILCRRNDAKIYGWKEKSQPDHYADQPWYCIAL